MTITEIDRYHGAMVGVLCGDALGAPYEWMNSDQIRPDLEKRGGLIPHDYKPFDYIDPWNKKRLVLKGHPTDDSELAAIVGISLATYPAFNASDLYKRLRSFIHERKSILTDIAYGSGGTLRAALLQETYEESIAKFIAGEIPTPPSNGSLMRCIAVPLFAFSSIERTIELAEKQSIITHRNPSAVASCIVYSVFVRFVLCGLSPQDAWNQTIDILKINTGFDEILSIDLTEPNYLTEIKGKEGWVVLSLRVAVWASITAQSFADGILKSIQVGGDTDTYAAIAGGILGAHFGLSGISQDWLDVLQGKNVMLTIADELFKLSHQ